MHRQFEHGASTSISYITHAFVHEQSSRDYTFEACIIGAVRVRCGVGEVDFIGTFVVEVVVLACSRVDGRGSRNLGDGSGTCLSVVEHDDPERVLGNMHVVGSCTQT